MDGFEILISDSKSTLDVFGCLQHLATNSCISLNLTCDVTKQNFVTIINQSSESQL